MNYELILNYFKTFCTDISNINSYFSDNSDFIFIGDFGKTFIAFGMKQINEKITDSFWSKSQTYEQPIAYNISIEHKYRTVCSKDCLENEGNEEAVVVIGTIERIHSSKDIYLTKLLGRKFVQTFLLNRNNDKQTIKSTVFAYLSPSDAFNDMISTEKFSKLSNYSNDSQEVINEDIEENNDNLEFEKISKNIDNLINEIDNNYESDIKLGFNQNNNHSKDLLPISLNELLTNESNDENNSKSKDSFDFEAYNYFNDICSQLEENDCKSKKLGNNMNEEWIQNLNTIESNNKTEKSGTSFADKLRNGLQSWQSLKLDEKTHEIRIIQNCGKPRIKANNYQNCGKSDKSSSFVGQQNITIIGSQNLEEMSEHNILFVANIPIAVSKMHFMSIFDIFGKVLSIKFVERTGIAFAFVYFDSKTSVESIMNSITGNNNLFISGYQLKVDRYKKRVQTNALSNQSQN